jgi:type II secretory pathway component PulM
MSARDRKLVMILAPLAAFALYWMVLLNPAMDRKASLDEPLATAQTDRDAAVARAAELESAKTTARWSSSCARSRSRCVSPT